MWKLSGDRDIIMIMVVIISILTMVKQMGLSRRFDTFQVNDAGHLRVRETVSFRQPAFPFH